MSNFTPGETLTAAALNAAFAEVTPPVADLLGGDGATFVPVTLDTTGLALNSDTLSNAGIVRFKQGTISVAGTITVDGNLTLNGGGTLSSAGGVSSVALTMPPGIFSVGGSPVTSAGTLAVTASGTSGGVVYFSTTGTLSSSGLLTQHALVVGGGAGAAPATIATGTSGLPLLSAGSGSDPGFSALSLAGAGVTGQLPLANIANIGTNTVLGNVTGGAAAPAALTTTQLTTLVNSFTTSLSGAAPASGGGSVNFLRADGTWAVPPGAGTVTSVAQTFTGGLISVAGSPVTGAGTLALTVAGTSGGVPYFSSGTTWATSAALGAHQIVLGGGAGAAPATSVALGSSGAPLISGGAGADPSFTTLNLASAAAVTGQLPLANIASIGTSTVLGNVGTASAAPSALTTTQLTTLINAFTTSLSGAAPASGGGTVNFLRADGTWATPPGTGTVTSVAQTFTGGIVSVAGSPITGAGTLALTVAGTSGGIPVFTTGTSWASSTLLATNSIILGGGATVGVKTSAGIQSNGVAQITLGAVGTGSGSTVWTGNTSGSFTMSVPAAVGGTVSMQWPASAGNAGQIWLSGGSGAQTTWGPVIPATGTSGGILGFTASGTLASSGALTANAIVLGGGAGATPTALGSLGTTTTVLHGNAAGAPTFGAVSLTADVSGTLPVANGGTGITNTPYVDLVFVIQGGGIAITTGFKYYLFVDFACTVGQWTLGTYDGTGSAVSDTMAVDVYADAYASLGTKTSMVGAGTKPNTSAANRGQAAPASWTTTSIAAGTWVGINVTTGPATAVNATLALRLTRT